MAADRVHNRWLALVAMTFPLLASCTHPESFSISPANMTATESRLNRVEGGSYIFVQSATLSTRLRFTTVHRWGLCIRARAAAAGVSPRLRVQLDGMPEHTLVIDDPQALPYWINFSSEPGLADLRLTLVTGAAGDGPALVIERIDVVPL